MLECRELIQKMAQDFKCKVWVCEKVGRRISFIQGLKAGNESFEPPKVVFEDEKFVVFAQVENEYPQLVEAARKVIDCVRNSTKDRKSPGKGPN